MSTHTLFAPLFIRAFEHSKAVAPVVMISSISRMVFPFTSGFASKASVRFVLRSQTSILCCFFVFLVFMSTRGLKGISLRMQNSSAMRYTTFFPPPYIGTGSAKIEIYSIEMSIRFGKPIHYGIHAVFSSFEFAEKNCFFRRTVIIICRGFSTFAVYCRECVFGAVLTKAFSAQSFSAADTSVCKKSAAGTSEFIKIFS